MTGTAPLSAAADAVSATEAARFGEAVGRLLPERGRVGLAVSGGPDSLAMLLLAHTAMPGGFEVATVDHDLRPESAGEAKAVAKICASLGVSHATLRVKVSEGNVQEEARKARYAALAGWAAGRGLAALATAHHADDQAETVLMRLNRASGLAGLAGVRERGTVPGGTLPVLRPLLGWRRAELGAIVARAGIEPVEDPSNRDERFDRARIRLALAGADWLDSAALAQSAAHLADAEEALVWVTGQEWARGVEAGEGCIRYTPAAPRALALRVVERIIAELGGTPRGGAVARLVETLQQGEPGTLAGVAARPESGSWVFRPEPPRRS